MISYQAKLAFDKTVEDLENTLIRLERVSPVLLQRFFDHLPDLAGVADFNGRIILCNKAVTDLLGYEIDEFMAVPYGEFVHPDDLPKTRLVEKSLQRGESLIDFSNRYRHKDGYYVLMLWRAVPDLDHDRIFFVARKVG